MENTRSVCVCVCFFLITGALSILPSELRADLPDEALEGPRRDQATTPGARRLVHDLHQFPEPFRHPARVAQGVVQVELSAVPAKKACAVNHTEVRDALAFEHVNS